MKPKTKGGTTSITVPGIPNELYYELTRLKAELKCRTWLELLERIARAYRRGLVEKLERLQG